MPPLKSPPIKPDKSMLFFHIWNANFSVTSINSQIYMTKPKQAKKELSENTGTTFSAIMPPFTSRGKGGGHNCGNDSTLYIVHSGGDEFGPKCKFLEYQIWALLYLLRLKRSFDWGVRISL